MVQFSDTLTASSWEDMKTTSGNFALDQVSSKKARFYRVVSVE
ncbi:uncharacterized protein METZ01_LOCUS279444 [marine metagenome]|uniref:Uncharacterized protein n=1 Tax=marine metagenome TaxID=408172 RepID=A0A382KQ60_9ZZZZ